MSCVLLVLPKIKLPKVIVALPKTTSLAKLLLRDRIDSRPVVTTLEGDKLNLSAFKVMFLA